MPKKRSVTQKSKVKPAKAAASKPKSKPAAQKSRSTKKTFLPTMILVVVLLGLGLQALFLGKKHAAQDIRFQQVGSVIEKSPRAYRGYACDKQGNFFQLNGSGDDWIVSKYSPANKNLTYFEATSTEDQIINASDLVAGAKGYVYVLQSNGIIKVFSNNLKYIRTLDSGLAGAVSLDLDSKGRIFVASRQENKVIILAPDGSLETELGSPESKTGSLARPTRVVVGKDDQLIVLENLPTGIHIKVFSPELKSIREFNIDKMNFIEWTLMGIDPNGLLYLNDHAGQEGVVIYDSNKGRFHGKSLATDTRQTFDHPGGLAINKWTGAIYVAYIPGVVQCRLPDPS